MFPLALSLLDYVKKINKYNLKNCLHLAYKLPLNTENISMRKIYFLQVIIDWLVHLKNLEKQNSITFQQFLMCIRAEQSDPDVC